MDSGGPRSDELLEKRLTAVVAGGVQWFPGHMAKADREINKLLKLVNVVVEVVDARVPASSRQRDLARLAGGKAHVLALAKEDLAEGAANTRWLEFFRRNGQPAFLINALQGTGVGAFLRHLAKKEGGIRALVAGVPNTGKSSLINRVCKRAAAPTGARPGITRGVQWLQASPGVEFLDTPGLLWPKIENLLQGLKLLWIGSIGENAYEALPAGAALALYLHHTHPGMMAARYGPEVEEVDDPPGMIAAIGRRRGCLVSGGEVDLAQAAAVLLAEMRQGRLGRITLDEPPAGAPASS